MQIAIPRVVRNFLAIGQTRSAKERLGLEATHGAPHCTCPREKVRETLLKSAESRGCTADQLLLARLAEMQCRIVRALGEVSVEQFCNSGPEGYIVMLLAGEGFDIVVEFRPFLRLPVLYYETLISPGALQERRSHLLGRILEKAPSISKELAEQKLIEQLRTGANHWDGLKKADLALEILCENNTAFKALLFVEKDEELFLPAFEKSPRRLRQLAQQILGSLDLREAELT